MPVAIYGALAFVWRILIGLGLIIAASVLLQGAGLVLSGIGVVTWFALPILRQIVSLTDSNGQVKINKIRTAVSVACLVGFVVAGVYVFQAPATKSAPAIVQLHNESVIRSDASGFVTTPTRR